MRDGVSAEIQTHGGADSAQWSVLELDDNFTAYTATQPSSQIAVEILSHRWHPLTSGY